MRLWEYVGSAVAVAGGVALFLWLFFFATPLTGEVWVQAAREGRLLTMYAYKLPELKEINFPYGASVEIATVAQKTLMLDATPSPDGVVAYLSKSKGQWQVFFSDHGTERVITHTPTMKRDLVFSPDGLSVAFSEISATSSVAMRQNPDSWSVVRMLRSGASVVVGTGTHPHALRGSETVAVTSRGVESFAVGRDPEILIKSVVPVFESPLAVSRDGNRLAWVNPADHSLQVFEYTAAHTYAPIVIKEAFPATSLLFSFDGTALIATRSREHDVVLTHIRLPSGVEHNIPQLHADDVVTAWIQDE